MATVRELSPREVEVVELIAEGEPYKTIAYQMGLSEHTVRAYARKAAWKLQVENGTVRESLLRWWLEGGRELHADSDGEPPI